MENYDAMNGCSTDEEVHIAVVLGTARPKNKSRFVAEYIAPILDNNEDVTVTFVNVADHVVKPYTDRVAKGNGYEPGSWGDIAERMDAFVFVLPEYNRGYPGEWKLLMDMLYKEPYTGKTAGLVGVSSGRFGGVRVTENAALSLMARGMYVMKDMLYITDIEESFMGGGLISDTVDREIHTFVDSFIQCAKKMRRLNK